MNKLKPFVTLPNKDEMSTLLRAACSSDHTDYLLPILSAKAGQEFRGLDLVNMLRDAVRGCPGNEHALVPKLIKAFAGGNHQLASFSVGLFSRNITTL